MSLWTVILLSPPFAALTYRAPAVLPEGALRPGMRVLAPLGQGLRVGVLEGPAASAPEGVEARELAWPLERRPLFTPGYLELVRTLAGRQVEPVGRILAAVLPKGLRTSQVRFGLSHPSFPRQLPARNLLALHESERRLLAGLWESGRMAEPAAGGDEEHVRLLVDPPWPVRPGAVRQIAMLEHLHEHGPMPLPALLKAVAGGRPQLTALARAGAVAVGPPPEEASAGEEGGAPAPEGAVIALSPTPEQETALSALLADLESGVGAVRLLHGVTGSGKTLLYLRLAEAALRRGRSVALLAPEVALAVSLWRVVRENLVGRPDLPCRALLSHGYQSPGTRERAYLEVARENGPTLIVGTRSALLLPLANLGLVVLDEEHDESFKQEERLPYQAKEVAYYLARRDRALLVLGSATPDVKTFHAAREGGIAAVTLKGRVGESRLPEVQLVNMKGASRESPLAPESLASLSEALAAGDQAVIMLNRRGYAPLMYCLSCETPARCPECQVAMTYHKARERLVCHYCGLSKPFPLNCPSCGQMTWLPMGEGTERLAERIQEILPEGVGVLRLDRDAARRQERMEQILADFAARKAQVLVGTQMLSKGHHFPDVTRVVVADADLGLNLPDYRAAERSFQLLVQVSGRAGRSEKPGTVLIQTRTPDNPFWRFVANCDYEGFCALELEKRRKFGYPPFVRLALLRMSFPVGWDKGAAMLAELSRALRQEGTARGVRVLGPAPAPLSMLAGRKRFHCMLKAQDWPSIRAMYTKVRALVPPGGDFRLGLDLDPVSML